MLALHLDEIRWRNDFDALVLTKLEQMLVSTHQIIRTARGRTFEDAVVSWVFFHRVYSLLWFDTLGETGNLLDCLIDLLVWPAKLFTPQDPDDFIQDASETARWMAPSSTSSRNCRGLPEKFSPEMMTFVSAVTRSTFLSGALRTRSRNLRVHVFRGQSTRAGITFSEFERFAPLRMAKASFNGITH
jgi:hypothetical protein